MIIPSRNGPTGYRIIVQGTARLNALQLFIQQFINGIQIGSVYALIAVGYTMVYGVLKFINFAHGDVYMVGAFIGFFTVSGLLAPLSPTLQGVSALLLCMIGCAALGAFIERLAYRPLRNGLSAGDAIPWAAFWALYAGLFVGPVVEAHTPLVSASAFLIVWVAAFLLLIPVLRRLFMVIGAKLRPSRNRLTALITAIGMSLLLENQGQAVFGVTPRAYQIAGVDGGRKIHLGPLEISISTGQFIVLIAAVGLTILLVYIVRHTRTGRAIRAVSYDPEAAALMGIPTDRVIAMTFIIGSALAGAAGFLNHGLTRISFDANVGISLGLKAFVAAVLGGIGSIEGAVLGALLMGLAENFTAGSSLSSFKDAIAFVILIIVLLFRPAGLLGRHVTEKV
jgi:branched-chain amino acid transport system permease protein